MGKLDLIETDILYALMDIKDAHALKQHGIILESIDCEDFVISAHLRSEHNLSFFDSHYAAYVKRTKGRIISMDKAYDQISEIIRIDPRSLVEVK
jgi:predicted nucleic acid-binding protein